MRILFWNVKGNPNTAPLIRQIVEEHDIQVVGVAEAPKDSSAWLVRELANYAPFRPVPRYPSKLQLLAADSLVTKPRHEHPGRRLLIASIAVPHRSEDLTLAVAHMPSKLHRDTADQVSLARGLSEDIREVEERVRHRRTILIGDLNANPFEESLAKVDALNAVMSREVARRGQREFDHKSYPFFYNPMWSRLGDLSPGPPGTHFYSKGESVAYYWHCFDQCLIRPELLSAFSSDGLHVLDRIGSTNLTDPKGITTGLSDHLPLILKLDW